MARRALAVVCVVAALTLLQAVAQNKPEVNPPYDVRAHYTKYEYNIPMRDGVKLFTSIYVPKDSSTPYPFLMNRTPYSVAPYGVDNYRTSIGPSESFEKSGYIFAYQDVRGRYMSEGTFQEMRPHIDNKTSKNDVDDSTDTYDTIEWLLKNVPNNNGRVGIRGDLVPRFLYFREHHRFASSAEGGVAAGSDDEPVHGRRRVSHCRCSALPRRDR